MSQIEKQSLSLNYFFKSHMESVGFLKLTTILELKAVKQINVKKSTVIIHKKRLSADDHFVTLKRNPFISA